MTRFAEGHRFPPSNQPTRALGLAVAVGVGYFLAARLGLVLQTEVGTAAIWPAAGIAIGTSIVFGRNARLAIAAAIAIATIASSLTIGRSSWLAIALGLINAGQALLTAYLIERWFDRPFTFDDVRPRPGFCGRRRARRRSVRRWQRGGNDPVECHGASVGGLARVVPVGCGRNCGGRAALDCQCSAVARTTVQRGMDSCRRYARPSGLGQSLYGDQPGRLLDYI